jgi:hypothetical protein
MVTGRTGCLLSDKPPVADLKYFLDFQHHKMWAPALGELPLGPCSNRQQGSSPALHFSPLSAKLYVSPTQVRDLSVPKCSFFFPKWHA